VSLPATLATGARTLALLLLTGMSATARDTWLLPTHASVPVGTRIRFAMSSAVQFPTPDSAVSLDRVVAAQTEVRLGGVTRALRVAPSQAPGVTVFEHDMDRAGIATAFATLRAKTHALPATAVSRYLDEVHASRAVRERWVSAPPSVWRASHSAFVKTFVAVGSVNADSTWRDPVGQAFEFVPLQDPTTLRVGDTLRVRLLLCGAPLPNASVVRQRAGGAPVRVFESNSVGDVMLPFDAAGAWLVKTTFISPQGQEPVCLDGDADAWRSAVTTITLGVRAAAPRPR
jgi:hypothetical protein